MAKTRQEVRQQDARDIAAMALKAATDVINAQSLDAGIALAACVHAGYWLLAEARAQSLLCVAPLEAMGMQEEA